MGKSRTLAYLGNLSGTSFPTDPVENLDFFRTDEGLLYRYIGGNWVPEPYVRDAEDLIINGAFELAQRGSSQTTSGYGTFDRWSFGHLGGTVTSSRQDFGGGDTLGSECPTSFSRVAISGQSAAADYQARTQAIENVRSYAGQEITVLGWMRRTAGAGNTHLELAQYFGTGGSPSAQVNTDFGRITLGASWAPFALTGVVPSITGKTLGSNGDHSLRVNFWSSAGSNFNSRVQSLGIQTITNDLWGVHIRRGRVPVEAANFYVKPPIWDTWRLSQRYYSTLPAGALDVDFGSTQIINYYAQALLPQRMRQGPTGALASIASSNNLAGGYPVLTVMTADRVRVQVQNAAANTRTWCIFSGSHTFDAEL